MTYPDHPPSPRNKRHLVFELRIVEKKPGCMRGDVVAEDHELKFLKKNMGKHVMLIDEGALEDVPNHMHNMVIIDMYLRNLRECLMGVLK